jgi:ABC-type transport system involved in multi-copper enzyme maturation permease subunit
MKAIYLIGVNFLREQRWPILVLLLWVTGSSLASGVGADRLAVDDVLFFLKTQAVYGVAFIAFLASAAIHNERKSRRIVAVLSKGVRRGEYIAGLLGGVLVAGAIYVLAMGAAGSFMFKAAGLHIAQLWEVMALLMTALVVTSTVAMFFSTFLTPLFATAATAFALGTPAIAARIIGGGWTRVLPVYELMNSIISFSVNTAAGWSPIWSIVFWSMVDSLVLWLAGSWLFSYRDIAVAIE